MRPGTVQATGVRFGHSSAPPLPHDKREVPLVDKEAGASNAVGPRGSANFPRTRASRLR